MMRYSSRFFRYFHGVRMVIKGQEMSKSGVLAIVSKAILLLSVAKEFTCKAVNNEQKFSHMRFETKNTWFFIRLLRMQWTGYNRQFLRKKEKNYWIRMKQLKSQEYKIRKYVLENLIITESHGDTPGRVYKLLLQVRKGPVSYLAS